MKFFLSIVVYALAILATTAVCADPPFTCQNGRDAVALQKSFAKIDFTKPCPTLNQIACDGDSTAKCTPGADGNNVWSIQPCAATLKCFALPLVNKAGTSVTCDTQADRDDRVNRALATCPKKKKRSMRMRKI
ncbi:11553_t:CDS:2 [Acaulospora morrowiae]|uniref:11553_t:CDS:1 n=1 Tax=Acaulospora morrowiae TaxID=94023 RepID=A0A9N9AZ19_9GLOM|nr:11553_t:CDS:2 [Acaulospora morrowiae]